mgnify:CR=1 FL=1
MNARRRVVLAQEATHELLLCQLLQECWPNLSVHRWDREREPQRLLVPASLVVVAANAIAMHASIVSIASRLDEAMSRICWSIKARSHHRRRPLGIAQTASIRKLAVATAVLAP